MNELKTAIVAIITASLILPMTLFAQNAQQIDSQKVTEQIQISDSLLRQTGIKFINDDGKQLNLSKLVASGISASGEFRAVLPANESTHLIRPLGILVKRVSTDASGVNILVAFASENFSDIFSSQIIKYDFSKSDNDNQAQIRLILNKMTNDISNQLVVGKNQSSFEKIANIFIPRAEANPNDKFQSAILAATGLCELSLALSLIFSKRSYFGKNIVLGTANIIGTLALLSNAGNDIRKAFHISLPWDEK